MRIRRLAAAALAIAVIAPCGPARAIDAATERAIARAFDEAGVVVVAERGGRGRRGGAAWKRAPEAVRRSLSPDALERAALEALQRLDTEARSAPSARPRTRVARTAESAAPAAPALQTEAVPAPPAPAPTPLRADVATPAPARGVPPARRALAWAGVASAVAAAAALALRRRARRAAVAAPVSPPALVASLAPADDPRATLPRVAVEAAPAATSTPADAFPRGGRYELLREIGRGGMGVVFQARDTRLDRIVALKRLPDVLAREPRYVELLLREARSAARLNHRNIVTVHDVDQENGTLFITMEYLEGASLEALRRERGRLAPRPAIWTAQQVAAGLAYAHAHGIVHRDVKPANLFVTRDRTVKLMDFGIAKIVEEARRARTLLGGTPAYMAPEQASGEPVDGRADLYALGATLFELLTGEPPFPDGDPIRHHRTTPPPDPRERVDGIPDALAELVLALLRKRPDDRPQDAATVGASLARIAESLPPLRSAA